MKYKTIYYTVFYAINVLEKRMDAIRNEEPSQDNARALRVGRPTSYYCCARIGFLDGSKC